MSRILVFGAHGKVAQLLTPKLVARGHEVTSVVRNHDYFPAIEALGGKPTLVDLERVGIDELIDLVSGHDAIVWSAGAGGGSPTRTYAIDRDAQVYSIQAAIIAQVRRYITVSWSGSRLNHGVDQADSFFPYAEAKAIADAVLRDSDLDWTVLGPTALTTDPGTGHISSALEHGTVSRDDVATTVVAALDDPSTVGRTIRFASGETPIGEFVAQASGD